MASPLFAILQSINHTLEDGSPGEIRTLVKDSRGPYAWPLHHRAVDFNKTLRWLLTLTLLCFVCFFLRFSNAVTFLANLIVAVTMP